MSGEHLVAENGGTDRMSDVQYQNEPTSHWLSALGSEVESVQKDAVQALRRIGAPAVPELIQALQNENWRLRNQAAVALGTIGAEARDAIPALTGLLGAQDKYIRSNAAVALGRIGREASTAVPALTEALKDKDEDVRGEAAAALGRMGPQAKASIPALVELLKDGHKAVRKQAAGALKAIEPETATRLLGLRARLSRWFERSR